MNVRTPNENPLDRPRIRHLLKLGIFAALMVLAGDMLLGWDVHDASKSGMEGFLSMYLRLPETALRNAITAGWINPKVFSPRLMKRKTVCGNGWEKCMRKPQFSAWRGSLHSGV